MHGDGIDGSFEESFDRLFVRAEHVAQRLLGDRGAAEDVAAEALARAYLRWDRLEGPDHRTAFVLRVATNLAIDGARRRSRRFPAPAAEADQSEAATLRLALVEALRALPRRQREVVALRFLSDLSEADVASALGVSPGTVKTHLHRALATLRHRLGDLAPPDLDLKEA